MGLYPADTDSSDDDLFTGNVFWDEGGKDNQAFEAGEAQEKKEKDPSAEEPTG